MSSKQFKTERISYCWYKVAKYYLFRLLISTVYLLNFIVILSKIRRYNTEKPALITSVTRGLHKIRDRSKKCYLKQLTKVSMVSILEANISCAIWRQAVQSDLIIVELLICA